MLRIVETLAVRKLSIIEYHGKPNKEFGGYIQDFTVLVTRESEHEPFKQDLAELEREIPLTGLSFSDRAVREVDTFRPRTPIPTLQINKPLQDGDTPRSS